MDALSRSRHAFLASEAGAYITGTSAAIDGGLDAGVAGLDSVELRRSRA